MLCWAPGGSGGPQAQQWLSPGGVGYRRGLLSGAQPSRGCVGLSTVGFQEFPCGGKSVLQGEQLMRRQRRSVAPGRGARTPRLRLRAHSWSMSSRPRVTQSALPKLQLTRSAAPGRTAPKCDYSFLTHPACQPLPTAYRTCWERAPRASRARFMPLDGDLWHRGPSWVALPGSGGPLS